MTPLYQHLLNYNTPLVVNDIQKDARLEPIFDRLRRRGTAALLVLPLVIENEVVGNLSLEANEARHFSAEEVDLAWRVADQVAVVLARVRLDQGHRRLSAAIEQSAESVVITDTQGTILYVNPKL